jgi:hypothetical protein
VDFSQQLAQSTLACFGEHAFLFALCYGWRDFVDKNEIGSGRVFEDLNLPNCESNLCGDFVKFIKSLNLAPEVGFEPTIRLRRINSEVSFEPISALSRFESFLSRERS